MRVFVSSVVKCYKDYRRAAKVAIECLAFEPVVMDVTYHSSPESPRVACLDQVEKSDVVVLLMGARYGGVLRSGKSATHEEWEHARNINSRVLVFVEEVDSREPDQAAFLKQVGDWVEGHYWTKYSTDQELIPLIVRALRELEMSDASLGQDPAECLPPNCRERIDMLRKVSAPTADRLLGWLSDPGSRRPGYLCRLIDDPPSWLVDADALAWEILSDFMEAHDLSDSSVPRQMAIELGTPRRFSYLIDQSLSLSEDGDREGAEALLTKVPDSHPLLPAARARLAGDAQDVVEVIRTAQLHKDEDADLALHSAVMLVWAFGALERFDLAVEVLREVNQRFPDRAWLLFYQAQYTYNAAVVQGGFDSPIGQGLLAESAELALRSRDCFRVWNGPSQRAVAFATKLFGLLEDPWGVINVASPAPMGEATTLEAEDPVVKRNLAEAKLFLGHYEDADTLDLEGIDPSERARIQGMKALSLGDEAAVCLLKKALALAKDNASRQKAMRGLAMAGQIDEEGLRKVTEADAALFRGLASVNRGNMAEAIRVLSPYRLESLFHAHCLAEAEYRVGNPGEAVKTLVDAAEQFESMLLYSEATEFLIGQGEFEKAEDLAAETLARGPSPMVRHSLMIMLVKIARQLRNWQKMEAYARTMSSSFPQDTWAAQMVVYALHHQGRDQHAWGYLVGNDLQPFDENTALLAVKVYRLADAPDQAERLLQIANTFGDSEQVLGYALTTLMLKRDQIRLDDRQTTLLQELIEEFVQRYPESDILQRHTAPQPEELFKKVGLTTDALKSEFERSEYLLQRVSYGHWPFGAILWERPDLTYASVLFTMEGGWLTAISTDSDERETERLAARQAINGSVAVDTSVAVVGTNAELDIRRLGGHSKACWWQMN